MRTGPAQKYMTGFVLTIALVMGSLWSLNAVVDPLWYFKGNQVTGENIVLNERYAKVNRFVRDDTDYDCLIFGSSRMTLFDPTAVKGHTCFNLAVSAGTIDDHLAIARYVKDRGADPDLLIVAAEEFNFLTPIDQSAPMPRFIEAGSLPPAHYLTYTSFSSLSMSIKTLRGQHPVPRYYDDHLMPRVIDGTPHYNPSKVADRAIKASTGWTMTPERADRYAEMKTLFPDADYVVIVPPLSPWLFKTRVIDAPGGLDLYLEAMATVRASADRFFDFATENDLTIDPRNTYDGSHFFPPVLDAVAYTIANDRISDGFGARMTAQMSTDEHKAHYPLDLAAIESEWDYAIAVDDDPEKDELLAGDGPSDPSLTAATNRVPEPGDLLPPTGNAFR